MEGGSALQLSHLRQHTEHACLNSSFWGTGIGEYKKVRAELIQSEFSYHFESPLNVDALTPGDSWVGQAISSTAPPWDIHTLAPQVPEGLRYH